MKSPKGLQLSASRIWLGAPITQPPDAIFCIKAREAVRLLTIQLATSCRSTTNTTYTSHSSMADLKNRHTIYGYPSQHDHEQMRARGDFEDRVYLDPHQESHIPWRNRYFNYSKQARAYVSPQPQPPSQDHRDIYPIHPLIATAEDRPHNAHLGDIMVRDVRYNALTAEVTPMFVYEQRMFAVYPPVTKAVLYCKELPWAIRVENPDGIKVADVVERIHDELAEALTVSEWWIFDAKDRTAMSQACKAAIALGLRGGTDTIRRVDRLGSKHILDGIRKPTSTADQEFIKQRTFGRKKEGEHHYILEFRKEDK